MSSFVTSVAIPFSSGLCSFRSGGTRIGIVLRSQSLFHQVCVRSGAVQGRSLCNRVAIPFSSGLCSFPELRGKELAVEVAIPFSSGLCSFALVADQMGLGKTSQSLFHQVCVRSEAHYIKNTKAKRVAIPFSSGLCSFLDISSLKGSLVGESGRNPFFIRSVFVQGRDEGFFFFSRGRNPFFIRSVFVPVV